MGKQRKLFWKRYQSSAFALLLSFLVFSGCATTSTQEKPRDLSDVERARMLVEVANGALIEGDPTGALQSLARAETIESDLPELHHSKALAYFAKHDLNTALVSAKRAVELNPKYSEAQNTFGKLLVDAGKYEEAETHLDVAANDPLYRDAYKAWTNLGVLKYRLGNYSLAESFVNRAIQEAPAKACVAYYYRGHIQLNEKKLPEAIESYSLATKKICARFGEAQFALGLAYQKNRQYQLAKKAFLEIQERFPNTKLAERALDQLKYIP